MQNLRKTMEEIHSHILIRYYQKLFAHNNKEITNLNAMEISMLEVIYHLQQPTFTPRGSLPVSFDLYSGKFTFDVFIYDRVV